MGNNMLPPVRNFSYDQRFKKPSVPQHAERSLIAPRNQKDFIVSNAIENIIS